MPRVTISQQSGAEAEALFAAFVARNGGIWAPTGQHSDFGLDGRIEVTDVDGRLTGAEFGVQIKGTNRDRKSPQRIHSFGNVRRSTLRYWLSRITPTLIVGCELKRQQVFAEWAHVILAEPHSSGSRSDFVPLKFSSEPIDAGRWAEICKQALGWHDAFTAELSSTGASSLLRKVYAFLSEVEEELIELVCFMVMGDPRTTEYAIFGEINGETHQGISDRLLHPPRLIESGLAPNAIVACIEATASVVHRFHEDASSLLGEESALYPALAELSRLLNLIKKQLGVRPLQISSEASPSGAKSQPFEWVTVDIVGVMTGAVATLLSVRDFNHEIRPVLNIAEHRLEAISDHPLLSLLARTPASELLARWDSLP